jgi:hypothetical protein
LLTEARVLLDPREVGLQGMRERVRLGLEARAVDIRVGEKDVVDLADARWDLVVIDCFDHHGRQSFAQPFDLLELPRAPG